MKSVITAATLSLVLSTGICPAQDPVTPAPATTAVKKNEPGLIVARIHDGTFAGDISQEEQDKVSAAFPEIRHSFLNAAEATAAISGDRPLLDAAKSLKEDHYVFMLRDERGTIYHRSIAKATIDAGVTKVLSEAISRQKRVTDLLNAADASKGEERLQKLAEAAEASGTEAFRGTYPEYTKELLATPTAERKELLAKLGAHSKEQERADAVNRLHFDLSMTLRNLPDAATLEERVAKIDSFISERKLEGDFKQVITMRKYLTYSSAGKYAEALKALDEARDVLPASPLAARIPTFKEALKARMEKAEAEKKNPPAPAAPPSPDVPPPAPAPAPAPALPEK